MTNQSSLFDSYDKLNALDELFEASAAYRSSANFLKLMQFIQMDFHGKVLVNEVMIEVDYLFFVFFPDLAVGP